MIKAWNIDKLEMLPALRSVPSRQWCLLKPQSAEQLNRASSSTRLWCLIRKLSQTCCLTGHELRLNRLPMEQCKKKVSMKIQLYCGTSEAHGTLWDWGIGALTALVVWQKGPLLLLTSDSQGCNSDFSSFYDSLPSFLWNMKTSAYGCWQHRG